MTIRKIILLIAISFVWACACAQDGAPVAGNPVFPGWYADPEGIIFDDKYWIYPTYSAPYGEQVFLDAFSSPDLVNWTKHERIVDTDAIRWARYALWAPAAVKKDDRYYLFFAANDIQSDDALGGIGVAVADHPAGPFEDLLGEPLIGKFHHGAQPIDQFVFQDQDGQWYMYYGGWRHCNVARLNDDFTGFVPFEDGTVFKEVTPEGYVEGPFMFVRHGKYYFMWSEGGWTGPDYSVAYAVADSPFGPFEREGKILQQDPQVATGAGHHSVIRSPDDRYYMVYHRRPLGETDGNARVTCIDRMYFDEEGKIKPVVITDEGVAANPLGDSPPEPEPDGVVTLYRDCDFGGQAIALPEGEHSLDQLRNLGVRNDDVSSLKVRDGYQVTVYQHYNFQGRSLSFTQNEACLTEENFNDELSAIRYISISDLPCSRPGGLSHHPSGHLSYRRGVKPPASSSFEHCVPFYITLYPPTSTL